MLLFSVLPAVLPRRVQAAIAEAHQPGTGSVRQALCGALYEEVTDFYRLIATLEQQLAVPIPKPGGRTADSDLQQPMGCSMHTHCCKLFNTHGMHKRADKQAGLLN